MTSISKNQLLKTLCSAQKVLKLAKPNNGLYAEDAQSIIQNITQQLIDQGCPENEIVVDDKKVAWPGGFRFLPRYPMCGEIVKVVVRSKDLYTLGQSGVPVFSDIKDYQVDDSGSSLVARYDWGTLTLKAVA